MNTPVDVPPPRGDNGVPLLVQRLGDDMLMALRFFSRLPTGNAPHVPPVLSRMAPVLPLASVIIGLGPALALALLQWLLVPPLFGAVVAVALMVMVTGAMSEDALADAADGLFGGSTPEMRLEIMKDSRHGTYGVVAIVILLLARVTALGTVGHPAAAAGLLLTAPMIARSTALSLAFHLPPARSTGAAATAGTLDMGSLAIGLAGATVLAIVTGGFAVGWIGLLLGLALAVVVTAWWTWLCAKLVGGQTGDLVGALQALVEIAVLTGFMITA